jgi:hypothetical protein
MTIIVCPNCRRSYTVAYNNDDFICNCADLNDNLFEAQEDVLKIGEFVEFGASGGQPTNLRIGQENKAVATEARHFNPCLQVFDRTKRGNPLPLYRQRDRFTYIEVKKHDCR